MKKKKLPSFFLANDAQSATEFWAKMRLIATVGNGYGVKINLDLAMDNSFYLIETVASKYPVFVDMKMWNGKRTMAAVIQRLADYGVAMTNVWAQAEDMLELAVDVASNTEMSLFGLTVLTHYNDQWCRKYYRRNLKDTVRLLAKTSMKFGCDGYILPGTALSSVADLPGLKFNPAVRPGWFGDPQANFQKQIMSHTETIKNRADIVSCGSPIFQSEHPAGALRRILSEVEEAKKTR